MRVKCIHELCIILLVFKSYLHHIKVISLFYIDFWDNSQFPYFSGINPAPSGKPIFNVLNFQVSKRRANNLIFYGSHFLERTKRMSEGSQRTETRGPKKMGLCG